jgi:hypothetical protein
MAAIAVAGVGLMVVCSSSVAAAMMMGGDDDDDKKKKDDDKKKKKDDDADAGVSGRYVQLSFEADSPSKYILAVTEIRILDKDGTNMALNQPTEAPNGIHGGAAGNMTPMMAVDDDDDTFFHSAGGSHDVLIVDLGTVKEIAKIEIKNASSDRMAGGGPDSGDKGPTVTILGSDKTTVIKKTPEIKTIADKHTIDFTIATPVWV